MYCKAEYLSFRSVPCLSKSAKGKTVFACFEKFLVFVHYLFLDESVKKSAQGIFAVRKMTWESFIPIG